MKPSQIIQGQNPWAYEEYRKTDFQGCLKPHLAHPTCLNTRASPLQHPAKPRAPSPLSLPGPPAPPTASTSLISSQVDPPLPAGPDRSSPHQLASLGCHCPQQRRSLQDPTAQLSRTFPSGPRLGLALMWSPGSLNQSLGPNIEQLSLFLSLSPTSPHCPLQGWASSSLQKDFNWRSGLC